LGTVGPSVVFLVAMVGLVVYLTRTGRDAPRGSDEHADAAALG
jgi:hypothetical protein